jgi:hypothetical protein
MKGINSTDAIKRIKLPVNVVGFLIIISTEFVKQHVIMDIFSAIILCDIILYCINYLVNQYKIYDLEKASIRLKQNVVDMNE